jgi:hypothetical protein
MRRLAANPLNRDELAGEIHASVYSYTSRTGRLKWLLITMIDDEFIDQHRE